MMRTYLSNNFGARIRPVVDHELAAAHALEQRGDAAAAFAHLERAHVLGQGSTVQHVRVHWHMLQWAWRYQDEREFVGQLFRLVGAATKTALGWVPSGNTGGSRVSPFKPMPIASELAAHIAKARRR